MEIIDNFLDQQTFDVLQKTIISKDFPWYHHDNIVEDKETTNYNTSLFAHIVYNNYQPQSSIFSLLACILNQLDIKALIRIKLNNYSKTEKIEQHKAHIDYPYEHKGILYYLNSNNGYTVINNKKVDSIKNRLVKFDPSKLHSSTSSTDDNRINMIINYL